MRPEHLSRAGRLTGWRTLLFRHPPRSVSWGRPVQVAARSVHIAAMGLVLGGVAWSVPPAQLLWPLLLTTVSGLMLLGVDLYRSCVFLYQGAGAAVLLKLLLLGLGHALLSWRTELYLAATLVASVGSHMSGTWRHFSLLHGRVLETPRKR